VEADSVVSIGILDKFVEHLGNSGNVEQEVLGGKIGEDVKEHFWRETSEIRNLDGKKIYQVYCKLMSEGLNDKW